MALHFLYFLSLPLHSLEDPLVKKATFIHILALVRLFSIHSLQRSPRKRPPLVPKQSTVSANFYPWPRQQKGKATFRSLPSALNDLLHINKHKNKTIHCQAGLLHPFKKTKTVFTYCEVWGRSRPLSSQCILGVGLPRAAHLRETNGPGCMVWSINR